MVISTELFLLKPVSFLDQAFFFSLYSIAGLCMGSFASALIYRIPRNIPWSGLGRKSQNHGHQFSARSSCPHCQTDLGWKDLIPIASWVLQKGKCRYCHKAISFEYPVVELLSLTISIIIFFLAGVSLKAFFALMVLPFFLALLIIDVKYFILPDQLLGVLFVLGVTFIVCQHLIVPGSLTYGLTQELVLRLFSGAFFAGFLYVVGKTSSALLGRASLGLGDVKLFGVIGIWLGLDALPSVLILSGVYGLLFGMVWRKLSGENLFPFGPSIIAAFFCCFLIDPSFFYFLI